jgi:hypothetical protein
MKAILTDGTETFETRSNVGLMELEELSKQAWAATDGNLNWVVVDRGKHYCPDNCANGGHFGDWGDEMWECAVELPEDIEEFTDNPADPLCPCFKECKKEGKD